MNANKLTMTIRIADMPEVRAMLASWVLERSRDSFVAGVEYAGGGWQTDEAVQAEAERHARAHEEALNAVFDRIGSADEEC